LTKSGQFDLTPREYYSFVGN